MIAETQRKAALSLVDRLLRDFEATAPKVGDRKGWRKFADFAAIDSTALRQLVGYLRDLGLIYHALPLVKLDQEHMMKSIAMWLSDEVIGRSPDEIEWYRSRYDEFPLPLDDPTQQRRIQRSRKEQILVTVLSLVRQLRSVREVLIDLEPKESHAEAGDGPESLDGYASADWLEHNHGIIPSRLSEAKSAGKVKSKPATENQPDSEGRTVRTLYNVKDAIKHCSPKHVKKKTAPLRPRKS